MTDQMDVRFPPLPENQRLAFQGGSLLGDGFLLSAEERDALVSSSDKNSARIFPYVTGATIAQNTRARSDQWVISFDEMTLEEATQWPDLLRIVEQRVRPARQENRDARLRDRWWLHGTPRRELYRRIGATDRCIATARISNQLSFAFQPSAQIFASTVTVMATNSHTVFGILQSRVHSSWVLNWTARMRGAITYSLAESLESFPFPSDSPYTEIEEIRAAALQFETLRNEVMDENNVGCSRIQRDLRDGASRPDLQATYLSLNQRVIAAYGWSDLEAAALQVDQTTVDMDITDRLGALYEERVQPDEDEDDDP